MIMTAVLLLRGGVQNVLLSGNEEIGVRSSFYAIAAPAV